jgi:DNA-binding NarL/FixJ family response regulator
MAPFEAKSIIEALAFGKDPLSGATLQEQSVFHYPQVIRALFIAADNLALARSDEAVLPAATARKPKPAQPNAGLKWTPEQEIELLAAFDQGAPVREIAGRMGRSRASITARLVRLGRIQEDASPVPV